MVRGLAPMLAALKNARWRNSACRPPLGNPDFFPPSNRMNTSRSESFAPAVAPGKALGLDDVQALHGERPPVCVQYAGYTAR